MKKVYEPAEIDIFIFHKHDVVVASGEDTQIPAYTREDDETLIMRSYT